MSIPKPLSVDSPDQCGQRRNVDSGESRSGLDREMG